MTCGSSPEPNVRATRNLHPITGDGSHGGRRHARWDSHRMELDPRGQRFAAALTSTVLIVVLATGWGWLALAQTVVFAVTAPDPRKGPYADAYRALTLPPPGPPAEREPAAPVRFAQPVGFGFLAVATVGYLTGLTALGVVFTAF